jgi:hypothetical protein
MEQGQYETEYVQGIRHFNAREFFEAHEVWEEIWKRTTGRDRLYYKGLIHAAVALHHWGNGNWHGARKVYSSCVQYLTPYAPRHLGVNVRQFLMQLEDCFALLVHTPDPQAAAVLDPSKIPILELPLATHPASGGMGQ